MDRKVVKLGRSTLVVSLPKRWVELNRLKRGDVLSLDMRGDGSLTVYPQALKKEVREIALKIDVDEGKEAFVRKIISCYLNGYSIVRLISTNVFTMEQQRAIRDVAGKLYLRIMKADAREILIESLLDASRIPLDIGIRRMYIITISMCEDALKALEQRDAKLASVVYSLDDDVDQFSFLLLRMLRNAAFDLALADHMGLNPVDCLDYQTVVHRIEHVADHAMSIAKSVIALRHGERLPQFLLDPLLEVGREACGIFEEAIKAFFAKDVISANKIIDLQVKIEELNREIIEKTMEEKRASIVCATCSLSDSIARIAEYGAEVAEVTINRVIGRE